MSVETLTLSSLLSLIVLWVPAVCRQMQRMWTFNHGHGESDGPPHPALVTISHDGEYHTTELEDIGWVSFIKLLTIQCSSHRFGGGMQLRLGTGFVVWLVLRCNYMQVFF